VSVGELASLISGLLLVLWTASSVVRTLVVPRSTRSRLWQWAGAVTRVPARWVAARFARVESRDDVLAVAAPLSILVLLCGWLVSFMIGYGLLLYGRGGLSFPNALREAGSSLFTLGFATSNRAELTGLDFVAAATGPGTIGLLVGYLPTLYAAYNRRELEVTLLQARAGLPAWGPEILARHSQVDVVDQLVDLYLGWERWAADISESHTNYPVLIQFRSPQPYRNWLIGLLAVLDAAALQLAFNPSMDSSRSIRIALRAGFICLREIAHVEHIPFDEDPSPDDDIQLTYPEYLEGVARMREQEFPMERSPAEAWPHFRGWRVNYESIAYHLADRIDAVPARWSGPRRGLHGHVDVITPVNRTPTRP
jgi:hypothetical protein